MRGEHQSRMRVSGLLKGSSPHARGAPCGGFTRASSGGIIPACAGSTRLPRSAAQRLRDHPRMRGEHNSPGRLHSPHLGSSPHARGARCSVSYAIHHGRIIPACAGSTHRWNFAVGAVRDHPRMRGEHSPLEFCSRCSAGSSPHARGALAQRWDLWGLEGIIPACAGSTKTKAIRWQKG